VALNNVEQCASRLQRMAFRDFVSRLETIQRPLAEDIPRPPPEPDATAPLEGEGDEEVPSLLARDQYLYFNEDRTLIDAHFPVLRRQLQDFRTALFPTGGYSAYSLWIGPRGSVTGLHADHDYNTLIQCQGSKTLLFIPADQEALVYPSGKFDPGASLSAVDLTKPKHNAARFPRLRDATPILAHLGPGDAVCIPRGCYHFVVCTEGPSMSCALSLTPWHLKAREELQRVAHGAGLLGWSDAGCTCHDA
jgi:histone arginine demethylase JMJD6